MNSADTRTVASGSQLIDAFSWGVDYGLLLAEQERDSEDFFDAVGCMIHSAKYNVPSTRAPRRQPHSAAWRQVKKDALMNFIELVKTADKEGGRE